MKSHIKNNKIKSTDDKKPQSSLKGNPKPEIKNSNLKLFLIPALIAFIVLIVYLPSVDNDFTNWDDPTYVLENSMIRDLRSDNLKSYFTDPVSLNYHPLTMLSLGLDYKIADSLGEKSRDNLYPGLNPKIYHITNLIWHILNTLLVFIFIYFISGKNIFISSFVALLFGIHPMHVESVAWISERKDVMYTFFYLAALILYMKYIKSLKIKHLAYVFIFFTLSLLSKAVAVTLPVVLILIDYYTSRSLYKRIIFEKIPFLIMSIVFGIMAFNIQAQGAIAREGVISFLQKIVFASYGFVTYLYKLVIPINLSSFYPYPSLNADGSIPAYLIAMPLIVLLIISTIILLYKKNKVLAFGIGFYIITILLVLQLISVGRAVMAERYTYLPYIGIFYIIGYYLDIVIKSKTKNLSIIRYMTSGVLIGFVIWLGILTWDQVKVWKNSGTLWTQTIKSFPNADVAYKNRGNYYGQLNQPDKAMADYNILVANNQVDDQVWGNIGNIYRMRNDIPKAFEAYDNQVKLGPDQYKGYINRGITYSIEKKYDLAFADFNKAIELGAPLISVATNRAFTYLYAGMYESAIKDFDFLIKENPYDSNLFQNRGIAQFNLNKYEKAIIDFNNALKLNPGSGALFYNISVCYFRLNDTAKASEFVQLAIKAGYTVPQTFLNNFKS